MLYITCKYFCLVHRDGDGKCVKELTVKTAEEMKGLLDALLSFIKAKRGTKSVEK